MTTPLLSFEGIAKAYGSSVALAGVDLRVEPAEIVGIVGPNGAGKSTLLKIAAGLVRADRGSGSIAGEPAGSAPARRKLGYLAELFRFPDWIRAGELVELHQDLAGSSGGAAERSELLELVGLAGVAGRRVGGLSKGMQQRLGIAQALVGAPALVLLDEPTSALDPDGRRIVRELLAELRRRGTSIIVNSHLLGELERVCDRVVILSRGRVLLEGTVAELEAESAIELETDAGVRRLPGGREELADLVAASIAAGQRVYGARVVGTSLEQIYLRALEDDAP